MQMSRFAGVGVVLSLTGLSGCGEGVAGNSVGPGTPPIVAVVDGNNQSAAVGDPLPHPIIVSVISADGAPEVGETVNWSIVSGGGQVSAASTITDGAGHASVNWTLGTAVGEQRAMATVSYKVYPEVNDVVNLDISATASPPPAPKPAILHYDGTSWSVAVETLNMPPVLLNSIWSATPTAVFAVGAECGAPAIMRYDGASWSAPPDNSASCGLSDLTSVWGNSASDVFATFRGGIPPHLGGEIRHYDGHQWTTVYVPPCGGSGVQCPAFQAGWSSGPTDGFVVGDGGMIAHYDGTNWNPQASGTTQQLNGVWGVGSAGPAFAVGAVGTILSYDGTAWSAQASGTSQPLYAIWGTSANDIFAVGGAGTILHYNGTAWTAQSSGISAALYGVWGISGNSVFVVGDAHSILYYDGTSWTSQTSNAAINLRGVWGRSATDVFAVGKAQ